MASILMVLASSPHSSAGQQALALAESLAGQGHALILCCLQDAVGAGGASDCTRSVLHHLWEGGARWVVLGADLEMRGLETPEGASVVDRAGVVALLAGDYDRVIGAF